MSRIKNKEPELVVPELKDVYVGALLTTAAETFAGTCATEKFFATLAEPF
jgi:hypothetical protein